MKKLIVVLISVCVLALMSVPAFADSSKAVAKAEGELSLTQIGAKIPMGVIPQDLKFPQLIPYFGPENPGYRFRPLIDILLYSDSFSIGSLQAGITDRMFRENGLVKVTSPEALKQKIRVIYTGNGKNVKDERYQQKGYVMAKASGEATSLDAFQLTLLLANKMGSSVVHITRQGVNFTMYATGYGLALGGVKGGLNADGEGGQVASGMLGWSTGKSGANRDPWVQGIALEPVQ